MPQIDVITGDKRHRRWTPEQKRAIIEAAFAPGANRMEIARRADISSGQLYTWKKELGLGNALPFVQVVAKENAHEMPSGNPDPSDGAVTSCAELHVGSIVIRFSAATPPSLAVAMVKALVAP